LNRCLTKEAGQMMNTNMKKGPISSAMREIWPKPPRHYHIPLPTHQSSKNKEDTIPSAGQPWSDQNYRTLLAKHELHIHSGCLEIFAEAECI
jgi:hypothetical protein